MSYKTTDSHDRHVKQTTVRMVWIGLARPSRSSDYMLLARKKIWQRTMKIARLLQAGVIDDIKHLRCPGATCIRTEA